MAITITRNTIKLKPVETFRQEEAPVVTAAVYPGMLVDHKGTNLAGTNTVTPHATAVGRSERTVAVEEGLLGSNGNPNTGGTAPLATPYAIGARCKFLYMLPGAEFQAYLAATQTLVAGDYLTSNGDGAFKKSTAPATDFLVAKVLEAITTTTAGGFVAARML
jgi:hypothetical protein